MPLYTPWSAQSFYVDNWGTNPSATPGTSVTPGASNAEGSWTEVLADLPQEILALHLHVSNGGSTGAAKPQLLDIGWDPAGGTSYVEHVANIVCGGSGNPASGQPAKQFLFPICIPAGAAVAVRIQGANATAGTVRVAVKGWGQPSHPWLLPIGQYSETIGTITNSNGVSFTPGTAADGTWVSLGTTTRSLWWWQLGSQVDNGSQGAERCYIELAVGDGSNKRVIQRQMVAMSNAEIEGTMFGSHLTPWEAYCPVPAGAELWVRGRCEDAPNSGYNAVAIGIGG